MSKIQIKQIVRNSKFKSANNANRISSRFETTSSNELRRESVWSNQQQIFDSTQQAHTFENVSKCVYVRLVLEIV